MQLVILTLTAACVSALVSQHLHRYTYALTLTLTDLIVVLVIFCVTVALRHLDINIPVYKPDY